MDEKLPIETEVLTTAEQAELAAHESVIERGLKTFYEVGMALLDIRDSKLYREQFATFEEYCQGRWNLERRRAYQLIEASGIYENVKNFSHPPSIESHTKPLTALTPDEQRMAWEVVQQTAIDGLFDGFGRFGCDNFNLEHFQR